MIVATLAVLALMGQQHSPDPDPTIRDVIDALPERDGLSAWEYTGAEEAYAEAYFAARDYWLDPERMGGRTYFVRYSARPSFGQGGFRQVVIRNYREGWDGNAGRWSADYAYAQRLIYQNADVMEAFGRAFPLDSVLWALSRYTRISENWVLERRVYHPDIPTVVRSVPVRRDILDERTCPALTRALERLNLLEISPVHIRGYGPDRRPPGDTDPDRVVVTGDGTGFELEIKFQRGPEDHLYSLGLMGNHGSIPGEWIEAFEAETADCWRPDDGGPYR